MKSAGIKHYAKAIGVVGRQQGFFDQLIADLKDVSAKVNENLDFKKYLNDNHIKIEDKQKALEAIFQDFISDRTKNIVLLLIKNKKLNYLDQIIELAQKGHLSDDDINEAIIESMIPLTEDQEKELQRILETKIGKRVLLKNLINPNMIGGLIVKIGDRVIDGSLVGKIDNLKKKINSIE
jgi:F-type H+-transporting ATPase subunit delta